MKKNIEQMLQKLDRQIEQEKDELKKSLSVVNIMEYTNLNSNRLVFLQGKKDALLDVLDLLK